jgi:dihydropteroate synthase
MNRKIYYWKLRSVELQLGEKTLIMGILNVTPDSFSDGGRFSDPDRAYARARELEEEGADILDIGAESTSPGSQRVSAEEEWRRLVPVLKKLRDKLTIPISLDTYKAETAERAFEYGIEIVNDPSGLTFDADLAKTVSNANAGLVLNHMRGTPETWAKLPPLPDMIGSVARDLEATINRARRAGVDRNRIAIDPGLGFGKRREQNSEILAHLRQLAALDYPILTGPSRKSFLAQAVSAQVGEPDTLYATAAAVAISIMNGAHIVRVHDVKEMRAVCQIADEVARAADAKEAKEAAQAAQQAAERPVPRRTLREADERPRSVKPPIAKRAPQVELPVEATPHVQEREVQPEVEAPADQAVGQEAAAEMPAAQPEDAPEVQVSPANEPAPAPRREIRKEVQREARKEAGKESRPAAKPYADRPLRRDFSDRPPKRDFGDRPPRRDSGGSRPPGGDRPPRRDFGSSRPPAGDRPPRRDFGSSRPPTGDRPPRRDFGSSRPPTGDRPPRRDFGGSRPPTGDRPPRRDFGSSRPPTGDRPPRRDSGGGRPPTGDRPPRRDSGGGRPPGGERPPRRDFGDRPPRRDFGGSKPPGGDRPPRRDAGPPPRGKAPGGSGSRPPSRPFRKRP